MTLPRQKTASVKSVDASERLFVARVGVRSRRANRRAAKRPRSCQPIAARATAGGPAAPGWKRATLPFSVLSPVRPGRPIARAANEDAARAAALGHVEERLLQGAADDTQPIARGGEAHQRVKRLDADGPVGVEDRKFASRNAGRRVSRRSWPERASAGGACAAIRTSSASVPSPTPSARKNWPRPSATPSTFPSAIRKTPPASRAR